MTDQTVTQADLSSLSKKLDDLGDVLSANERGLLLAVFNLAAHALQAKMRASGGAGGGVSGRGETESGDGGLGRSTVGGGVSAQLPAAALPSLSEGFKNAFRPIGNNAFTIKDTNIAAGGVGIGVIW